MRIAFGFAGRPLPSLSFSCSPLRPIPTRPVEVRQQMYHRLWCYSQNEANERNTQIFLFVLSLDNAKHHTRPFRLMKRLANIYVEGSPSPAHPMFAVHGVLSLWTVVFKAESSRGRHDEVQTLAGLSRRYALLLLIASVALSVIPQSSTCFIVSFIRSPMSGPCLPGRSVHHPVRYVRRR